MATTKILPSLLSNDNPACSKKQSSINHDSYFSGFHWNDEILFLEVKNKESKNCVGINVTGYIKARNIGRKILVQDASINLKPQETKGKAFK